MLRCPAKKKVSHFTYEKARKAAAVVNRKNWRSGSRDVARPYICPFCGLWHVGRGARGRDQAGLDFEGLKRPAPTTI